VSTYPNYRRYPSSEGTCIGYLVNYRGHGSADYRYDFNFNLERVLVNFDF
jgi:hypothetical protein